MAAAVAEPAAPALGADGKPITPAADPAKPAEPAKPAATLDAVKAFLTEKGAKPEDLAKLDEAGMRAQYDKAQALAGVDLKLPDGFTMDPAAMDSLKEVILDDKLTPTERGQKLIDLHSSILKSAVEAPYAAWNQTQTDWQAQIKADKELGGANFDKMQSTIAKAIDSIGGTEAKAIREAFDFTGAGNNPAICRIFYRMAAALTEGGHVTGGALADTSKDFRGKVQSMYPSAADGKS